MVIEEPEPGWRIKEYYEWSIEERQRYIIFVGEENKVFQRIRENNQNDWKILELCKELLFENARLIQFYTEGIENDRKAIKELG